MNGAEEALDLPCPFAGQQRANRIDEASARLHQFRGDVEQPLLQRSTRRSRRSGVSRHRPSGLRRHVPLPEQGASTSTTLGAFAPVDQLFQFPGRTEQPGLDRGAGPLSARGQLRQARTVAVGRQDCGTRRRCRKANDLPPAPAQRSSMRSPSSGSHASAISWLPSSCTSTIHPRKQDGRRRGCPAAGESPMG